MIKIMQMYLITSTCTLYVNTVFESIVHLFLKSIYILVYKYILLSFYETLLISIGGRNTKYYI